MSQAIEPPQVTNVQAVQRADTTLVDITFDLADADGDTILVLVSILDSTGVDTVREAETFSGDLGSGVIPGQLGLEQNQNAAGKPQSQAENIDEGIHFGSG